MVLQGTNGKLRRYSQLENFPNDITTAASKNEYSLIDELDYQPSQRDPVWVASDTTLSAKTTAQKLSTVIHLAFKQNSQY